MAAIPGTKGRGLLSFGIKHGFAAYGGYTDYKDAREKGAGKLESLAKAGTEFAMGELLGGWYLPYQMLKSAPSIAVGVAEGASKLQRSMNKTSRQVPFANARFNDYSQAFTMRQAGMQMAEASRYNLQQTLMGNEAQYLVNNSR